MYLPLLVWLAIIIVGVIIVFSFIRGVIKIIMAMLFLVVVSAIVVSLVTGIRVYSDMSQFPNEKSYFVLVMDGRHVTGFVSKDGQKTMLDGGVLKESASQEGINSLVGQGGRLFIVSEAALDKMAAAEITIQDSKLDYPSAKKALRAEKSADEFYKLTGKKSGSGDAVLKFQIFSELLGNTGMQILLEVNSGEVDAYPKSAAIRFLEEVPASFVKSKLSLIEDKIRQRASEYGEGA